MIYTLFVNKETREILHNDANPEKLKVVTDNTHMTITHNSTMEEIEEVFQEHSAEVIHNSLHLLTQQPA